MTATPTSRSAPRIPSLDGLRAVSIAAVLLGHLSGTNGFPQVATGVISNPYVEMAGLGVRVFFVISGFLITRILMEEHRHHGSVSLRRFYLRRVMRIFPAYYVFVFVLILMALTGLIGLTTSDVAHALTYTINYSGDRSWSVGHLWSLAVEEQFYLLWPLVLVAIGLRRARVVVVLVLAVVPAIRIVEYLLLPNPVIGNSFQTTADALALGCAVALLEDRLSAHPWFNRVVDTGWLILAIMLMGLGLSVLTITAYAVGISITLIAIGLGLLHVVRHPEGTAGRFLNWRPVIFVGGLSYSLYLWQQVFLNRNSDAAFTSFPTNLILAVACAYISYIAVERPMLRLRPAVEARLIGARRPTTGPERAEASTPDGAPGAP